MSKGRLLWGISHSNAGMTLTYHHFYPIFLFPSLSIYFFSMCLSKQFNFLSFLETYIYKFCKIQLKSYFLYGGRPGWCLLQAWHTTWVELLPNQTMHWWWFADLNTIPSTASPIPAIALLATWVHGMPKLLFTFPVPSSKSRREASPFLTHYFCCPSTMSVTKCWKIIEFTSSAPIHVFFEFSFSVGYYIIWSAYPPFRVSIQPFSIIHLQWAKICSID